MITIKRTLCAITVAVGCSAVMAQLSADDPDWKESEVPPPPAFDLKRLIPVTIMAQSQLRWGVDPATIVISRDGVVRYVVVAQSSSGVVNAMYEGIHCKKAEFRRYARFQEGVGWIPAGDANWIAFRNSTNSRHPQVLAKEGICDGSAPPTSVADAIRRLRSTEGRL